MLNNFTCRTSLRRFSWKPCRSEKGDPQEGIQLKEDLTRRIHCAANARPHRKFLHERSANQYRRPQHNLLQPIERSIHNWRLSLHARNHRERPRSHSGAQAVRPLSPARFSMPTRFSEPTIKLCMQLPPRSPRLKARAPTILSRYSHTNSATGSGSITQAYGAPLCPYAPPE
jgi:hypothetical protein